MRRTCGIAFWQRLTGGWGRMRQRRIADNLSSHKVAGVREAIEARGASLWFLPPHSPDLNPIEQAFAKLKQLLRAEAQRTVEALWSAVGRLLDRFTSAECANYLAHAGYRYSG
jgi:transposase